MQGRLGARGVWNSASIAAGHAIDESGGVAWDSEEDDWPTGEVGREKGVKSK